MTFTDGLARVIREKHGEERLRALVDGMAVFEAEWFANHPDGGDDRAYHAAARARMRDVAPWLSWEG